MVECLRQSSSHKYLQVRFIDRSVHYFSRNEPLFLAVGLSRRTPSLVRETGSSSFKTHCLTVSARTN